MGSEPPITTDLLIRVADIAPCAIGCDGAARIGAMAIAVGGIP